MHAKMTFDDKPIRTSDLHCTFCGPRTWAVWDVVTEECVVFVCDKHHVEMSDAKIIRFERMRGKEDWDEIRGYRETFIRRRTKIILMNRKT